MKNRKFSNRTLSASTLKSHAASRNSKFDRLIKEDFPTWTPKEGPNRVRLLPGTWDEEDAYWGYTVFVHYQIGPDKQQYLCSESMESGEICPICDERRKADAGGDEEYAKKLRPTKRVAAWVIDRQTQNEGPKVWMMPQTLDKDVADRCVDKMTQEILNIVDPVDGYDVDFTREGSNQNTKYIGINIARRPNPITDDEDELDKWLDYIENNPIPDIFNYYPPEHIGRVFNGVTAPAPTSPSVSDEESSADPEPPWDEDNAAMTSEAPTESAPSGDETDRVSALRARLANRQK